MDGSRHECGRHVSSCGACRAVQVGPHLVGAPGSHRQGWQSSGCATVKLTAVGQRIGRREWGHAFTDDAELLELIAVAQLTLGPYILFDGLQTVLAVRVFVTLDMSLAEHQQR